MTEIKLPSVDTTEGSYYPMIDFLLKEVKYKINRRPRPPSITITAQERLFAAFVVHIGVVIPVGMNTRIVAIGISIV